MVRGPAGMVRWALVNGPLLVIEADHNGQDTGMKVGRAALWCSDGDRVGGERFWPVSLFVRPGTRLSSDIHVRVGPRSSGGPGAVVS